MRAAVLALILGVSTAGCLKVPEEFTEEPDAAPVAPTTAAELLERHVEGLGGETAVRAVAARTLEARMVLYPGEGCATEDDPFCADTEEQTGSFLFQSTADGRLYRRNVIGDGVEERGFDGKTGWVYLAPETLRIDTESEAKVNKEEAVLHWYLDVESRGVDLALLPSRKEDSDGNPRMLDGLAWKIGDAGIEKQLWFDRETGLRREETSGSEDGPGGTQVVIYEDYRDIDGVMVPHLIRVVNRFDGKTQRIDFQVQRVNHDGIDPTKFAIPQMPAPKAEPDTLLAQLAGAKVQAEEGTPKDVSAWMEYARLAFVAAHFDTVLEATNRALKLDPKEPEALVLQARVAVLQGRYTDAFKILKRAKKANVRAEILAREEGWVHLRRRDYAKFAKALRGGGNDGLADHYAGFGSKPIEGAVEGNACGVTIPLVTQKPLAIVDMAIGEKKVGAIFDTGAADLIVTQSLADELGLEITAKSQVAQGMPQVGHGRAASITVGGLTLKNVPVNVFDDAAIADMAGDESERVSAVLGVGLLTQYAVALDIPKGTLELVSRAKKCKSERDALLTGPSAPFYMHETHYLYLLATMNGAEGIYLLNTGMRGADMTANGQAYRHAAVATPPLKADEAPMARIEAFKVGAGPTVKDAEAAWGYFQQTQSSDGFRLDGMVGLGVMGQHRFALDFDSHRIYFPK
ncbi:MAG: aspartyl protease family protein [Myxococcota bacterium]